MRTSVLVVPGLICCIAIAACGDGDDATTVGQQADSKASGSTWGFTGPATPAGFDASKATRRLRARLDAALDLRVKGGIPNAFEVSPGRWCSVEGIPGTQIDEFTGDVVDTSVVVSGSGDAAVDVTRFVDVDQDSNPSVEDCKRAVSMVLASS